MTASANLTYVGGFSVTKQQPKGTQHIQQIQQQQQEINSLLLSKIQTAKNDERQLNQQKWKIKQANQDSNLHSMSTNNMKTDEIGPLLNLKPYQNLKGHFNKVLSLCWHPDNKHLLTASQDGFILVWDTTTSLKKSFIQLEDPYVTCCDISGNGKFVASGGLDSTCYVYKLDNGFLSGTGGAQPKKNSLLKQLLFGI
ncbi:unnamed protein product [Ambrosiozyma monospora]|uniref:Unnamed protein product n=1 Tax=Ambrosiozyma monospora TaxID=43982 RepID=A0ACB5TXF4_AMBMO|nr:unnamed protein product [Ambrosiozyma monospora]